jgi:hypothetical protein
MGRTPLAMLMLVLWAGTAGAEEKPRRPYSLQVFKVEVAPTKADGRVWDGTTIIKDLPDPKGLGPATFAAAVGKKLLAAGLDATAAPDVYAVVEVNGQKLQTSVVQDTYSASWSSTDHAVTVPLRAGDYLQIAVMDRDLQENTKDAIGSVLHKITDDELASGVIEIQGFDQVLLLQMIAKPVTRHELMYPPGRYRVTVHGASISSVKPRGVANAGKSWDILGGAPDAFGAATIAGVQIALPKVQDSLNPVWNASAEIDLDETSSLGITLVDKDLSDKSDDPIGTVSSVQLLAEPPGKDGWIHLTDRAAILDVAIELKAVAKPVTAEECRALADHVFKLAEAAGQAQAFDKLKNLSTDDLRACVSGTSRTQLECVMGAADLSAVPACR